MRGIRKAVGIIVYLDLIASFFGCNKPEHIEALDNAIQTETKEATTAIEVTADINRNEKNVIAPLSMDDLKIKGLMFGSIEDGAKALGNADITSLGVMEYDGREYKSADYKDAGVVITYVVDEDKISIFKMKIIDTSSLKITRGLGIGSSIEDVLNSFPGESILTNEENLIKIEFPGDDDLYYSKGRIYFDIKKWKRKLY